MPVVTISIGRGGRGTARELASGTWGRFIGNVNGQLNLAGATVYVDSAESIGIWDGLEEESRTWVAEVDAEGVELLRGGLRVLARRFEQDAIAFTVSPATELLEPVPWPVEL